MKKIKIAHLITDLDIGGAEMMLLKVLRNFDRTARNHLVISLKRNGKLVKRIEGAGARVMNLDMKWYNFPIGLIRLCAILKNEKPDILHNYLFHADIAGRICGRIAGVPSIISSLRSVNAGSGFREILLSMTDGLVDAVTAVSEKVALEHINKRITKESKVKVIYNGLELDSANNINDKSKLREKAGIAAGEFLILAIGNLRPVKGYSFIFDALRELSAKGRNMKLLIVGGGSYKRALDLELADKGLLGKVIFAGEMEDVSDFLNMADAFVMASLWEGLPNALLEAMAAGLPVIATKVGGIPEVVRDNENGILVEPKDGKALAEAIERVMLDKELSLRLSKNAQKIVRDNFDIKQTVKELDELYTELVSRHAKIKVLRIITRLNIGGPARQAILLNSELVKDGFDCILIAGSLSDNEGDMSYIADREGVMPIIIPEISRELSIWNDIVSFFKIYGIIKKEKPHIVHTHMAKAGTIGRLAAKAAGAPVIIHTFHGHVFHSYFSEHKTRFFIGIEKMLARFTSRIVAISARQKKEIMDYLSLKDNNKIAVIPLGFDLDKFLAWKDDTALRKELNIPKDAMTIGIVGRLTSVKNHDMFILAAKEIKMMNPGKVIRFMIVGDGELKDDLMRLARNTGIYDDFIFTGWRKDIDALYKIMDIVTLTSLNEGTPVSIIEALASAKPVVATDVGGVRDVVEDVKSGIVVPSKDIEAFVRAVTSLIRDKEKREAFGKYGREYTKSRHSKKQLVEAIKNLYYKELEAK